MHKDNKILLLAMGNDIMGDDGAAIEAAEILKNDFNGRIEMESVFGGGFELLDVLEGREKVLILDTIVSGKISLGGIIEFSAEDFKNVYASSPHYVGLPEVLKIGKALNIPFPDEIKILAIETDIQNEIKTGLSPEIQNKLPALIEKARIVLNKWID